MLASEAQAGSGKAGQPALFERPVCAAIARTNGIAFLAASETLDR